MDAKTLRNFIISGARSTEFELDNGVLFKIMIDKRIDIDGEYSISVSITVCKDNDKLADVISGYCLFVEQAYDTAINDLYIDLKQKEAHYRDIKEYSKYLLTEEINL